MAWMASSRGTQVALGRFSFTHDSPVVPDWTATCLSLESSASSLTLPSALRLTRPWLELRYGLVKSISFLRSSVMVKAETPTSALPPCLTRGMMVSNLVAGSHSMVRPSFLAMASIMSISKPSGLVPPSGMDSSGG